MIFLSDMPASLVIIAEASVSACRAVAPPVSPGIIVT